jgi:hypothetical protein
MSAPKKRAVRPQAKTLRHRFLYTDVTPQEYEEIREYCRQNRVSVSQFVADLLLRDAAKPKSKRKQKVILKPEITLTPEQVDRLELLTRLHQKETVGEYIQGILEPELELQRLHAPVDTKMLRFYLSDEEHKIVINHIKDSGMSARNYAAMLTLRAIRKTAKKRKN